MVDYVKQRILSAGAVQRLDRNDRPTTPDQNETRQFRSSLRDASYQFSAQAHNDELAVTPLVGLGKKSLLNKTIHHLMASADERLTICTPTLTCPRC